MEKAKKVLIVEDEVPLARALEVKLQKAGIYAHSVNSGTNALEELNKDQYTVLLLDIIMPKLDGWEVIKKIREQKIDIKIIIVSNLGQPEDVARAKDLGVIDFIVKSDNTLAQIVDRVVNL